MKQVIIMAYDKEGVIAIDRVLRGTSVTSQYYKMFLQKVLRSKIRKLCLGKLASGVSILHDNARPHMGATVWALLTDYGWETRRHAAHSPHRSPPDFDLFPKLKEPMKGIRIHD